MSLTGTTTNKFTQSFPTLFITLPLFLQCCVGPCSSSHSAVKPKHPAKPVQLCRHSSHFSAHVQALFSHPPLIYTNSTYITNLSVLLRGSWAGQASYLSKVTLMPDPPPTTQTPVFIIMANGHTLHTNKERQKKGEWVEGWTYLTTQPKVELCAVC